MIYSTSTTVAPTAESSPDVTARNSMEISQSGSASASASGSHASSIYSSAERARYTSKRYYQSRRVEKGGVDKPWTTRKKDPKEKWTLIIPLIGVGVGLLLAGTIIYLRIATTTVHQYCPVLMEDFSSGELNPKVWTQEVGVGGFGNGQFEQNTNNNDNAFIKNGQLWIKPTLQDATLVESNNVLDLRTQGCTSEAWTDCVAATNITNGTIINPVKSARLNTKLGASIKYGKVEVTAQFPSGDWMWPAIWMLPVNDTYGIWPSSGEIDIAESRGNNHTYGPGGNQIVSSTLHLGPSTDEDSWWRYNRYKTALHSTFAQNFHTFGLEWTDKYLFTYLDTKPLQILYLKFNKPLWQSGNYPVSSANGTRYVDPWSQTGHDSTPFDQDFYLLLNVAVGSTDGWWTDGVADKPWVDASPRAPLDFWNARSKWAPTWEEKGQMVVKSVKMWQLKGYNGC